MNRPKGYEIEPHVHNPVPGKSTGHRRKDAVFLQLQALLEPFGVTRYYTDGWGRHYRRLPLWLWHYLVRPLVAALPNSNGKQSVDYKLKKFVEGAELPPDKAHYTWRTIFSDMEKSQVLSDDFLATV